MESTTYKLMFLVQRLNISVVLVSATAINVSAQVNVIAMLNGMNFKVWKENVEIVLGCMDLDLALRTEHPTATTKNPNADKIEKWDRFNRVSLMIMKCSIREAFWGSITESTNVKKFLKELEQYFAKNEKLEMSNLLNKLIFMRYKAKRNIREYIMKMSNITGKLKALNQFKVGYNIQKEKWTVNELISYCVQEEEKLQRDKTESAHLASTSQNKNKKRAMDAAKGKTLIMVACGVDCQMMLKDSSSCERFILVGDGKKVLVKAIGTFRLLLKTGVYLDLIETFVALSFRQNLVSISSLDKSGYFCSFRNNKVSLSHNSNVVGTGSLIDNLYMLDIVTSDNEILHTSARDDYSRYGYLYFIHEKSQSVDVFKEFKAEVELQLGKKIKAVKSDCGGEYYGRYDRSGEQHPGPFVIFLKQCGIVPQYTMPGKPSMNGVAERRNRTLKDMFYNPTTRSFSRTGNARFLEDVEFGGKDKVRSVVFEEEDFVSLPNIAIVNDQAVIPAIVQDVTLEQDNNEVPYAAPIKQTQQP
ncbi:uncharacterized protein LOC112092986 [Morus notabilis]|uniref:uncharacterized protein LOC112092986 n=1 Tax=Morus notabilis TaxID=981085 RepID=UPI000CECE8B2|nr:uncharacterized protein LOC112092986 [Morus notabilis]